MSWLAANMGGNFPFGFKASQSRAASHLWTMLFGLSSMIVCIRVATHMQAIMLRGGDAANPVGILHALIA